MSAVTVDVAGAVMGGAARYKDELDRYLARAGRSDVRVIGSGRGLDPRWLVRRESVAAARGRRVALNNVSFVAPGGERWTLVANALHFLADSELAHLDPSLRHPAKRQGAVVRVAAKRSDVIVAPCTAMSQRIIRALPGTRDRVVVRPHPVSADSVPRMPREPVILSPVLFAPYKRMGAHLTQLLAALSAVSAPEVRVHVTARPGDLPSEVASDPRVEAMGSLSQQELRRVWAQSRAIFFPTSMESFGYPLAEARASGHPVIALDTAQNREVAGPALRGFLSGDLDSLCDAVARALNSDVTPDPSPFDPDAYFTWILGVAT